MNELSFCLVNLRFQRFSGNNKESTPNCPSKTKESKEIDDVKDSESKDKDKDKKQPVSFPPSNTTDSVRLKSRELLANALRQGKSKYFL